MFSVTYPTLVVLITAAWCAVRAICALRAKSLRPRREAQLILVYICLVVVAFPQVRKALARMNTKH